MKKYSFLPANILLPKENFEKWAVIACDQFTSEHEYWNKVDEIVGNAPSTLKITLPEIYLEGNDVDERIKSINENMDKYLTNGVLKEYPNSMIYVERATSGGIRRGIVGMINLSDYDYHKGSKCLIRATEATVIERIPPRVKIRKDAPLELPHVMLLIDDPNGTVIEPLCDKKNEMKVAYDFELMQGGGNIKGYFASEELQTRISEALEALVAGDENKLLFAVGDGNHSLATAKECSKLSSSPLAQHALVEVVNIHDESLHFEPIYRVLFNADVNDVLSSLKAELGTENNAKTATSQQFTYVTATEKGVLNLNATSKLPVGTLQTFLDKYLKEHPTVKIDYIHGIESTENLCKASGTIGFLFEGMKKSELFEAVKADGALPRKTFSMGHAEDKRYYIECRKIK